jgi:mannosyl-oligosaccharide alpha-1,2-mannosidase
MITRWRVIFGCTALLLIFFFLHNTRLDSLKSIPISTSPPHTLPESPTENIPHPVGKFDWAKVPHRYPLSSFRSLPSPVSGSIPKIQASFGRESSEQRRLRLQRLAAVKGNFTHAWNGYRNHAWLRDEVAPLSGRGLDPFGGWAATLVDSLGKAT